MATIFLDAALNPSGARKGRFMGQPNEGSLSTRKARPVGKKSRRNQSTGQLSAQDLISLFQSMPVPNRGYKNPNASKPSQMGTGMEQFYANNPQIARGPARQDQVDAELQRIREGGAAKGSAAVDFLKQTKGYTDANGQFVPPSIPIEPSSPYGTGSVVFTDKPTKGVMTDPLTGKQVGMGDYLGLQERTQMTKMGPGAEKAGASFLDAASMPKKMPDVKPRQAPVSAFENLFSGKYAPPVGGDFWAWEAANRAPNTVGDVNPNEVPVDMVAPQQVYNFIDPQTGYPTSGTLGEKELAKRATMGLIPGMGKAASSAGDSFATGFQKFMEMLLGKSIELPQNNFNFGDSRKTTFQPNSAYLYPQG